MFNWSQKRNGALLLCVAGLTACSGEPDADRALAENLETAESMIDAF